jgi:predicted DNA-binding transcriptional regulator AlpA
MPVPTEIARIEPLLTTEQLAEWLQKPRSWLDNNAERLGIPRLRLGRGVRYRLSDVVAWLEEQSGKGAA